MNNTVKRRLFDLAVAISLLLSAAAAGLWVRSLTIEDALERGEESYDFMAGSAGHKIHLANAQTPMNWITMGPDRLASRLEAGIHRIESSLKQWRRRVKTPMPNVTL